MSADRRHLTAAGRQTLTTLCLDELVGQPEKLGPRFGISLEKLLPHAQNRSVVTCEVPCLEAARFRLSLVTEFVRPTTVFTRVELHESTRAALTLCSTFRAAEARSIMAFVDGAFFDGDDSLSFAVVLLAEHRDESFALVGAFAQHIDLVADGLDRCGIVPSSATAELYAIFWAAAYLRCLKRTNAEFIGVFGLSIYSDCTFALDCAKHAAGLGGGSVLQEAVAAMCHDLQFVAPCSMEHVKAHVGQPWNELADTLASWSRKKACTVGKVDCRITDLIAPTWSDAGGWCTPLVWAFLDVAPPDVLAAYPVGFGDSVVGEQPSNDANPRLPPIREPVFVSHAPREALTMTFVTANVLTLKPRCGRDGGFSRRQASAASVASRSMRTLDVGCESCGLLETGKIAVLQRDFANDNVDVVGMQECRLRTAAKVRGEHFLMVNSASSHRGQYGCALWLRHSCTNVEGELHPRFALQDACVTFEDPRLLIVAVSSPSVCFTCAVIHAPCCRGDLVSRDELRSWWQWCDDAIAAHRAESWPLIILGDTNAHVGAVHDGHRIGRHGAERENEASVLLRSSLERHDLWLPATFERCFSGSDTHTWLGPNDAKARIDFVMLPVEWQPLTIVASVADHLDISWHSHDHLASRVCVRGMEMTGGNSGPIWRKALYDKRGLSDPVKHRQCCELVAKLPLIPWGVGVDDHWQLLRSQLLRILCTVCPIQPRPRKTWVSDRAWQLIEAKRPFRSLMLLLRRRIKVACLRRPLMPGVAMLTTTPRLRR